MITQIKGFKCTLIDTYTDESVATILIKAESSDEALLKVNENYCLHSDFVIDDITEIPVEDVRVMK